MIECLTLRDRMPDMVHRSLTWSQEEEQHIATCSDCAAEWLLVRRGAALHADLAIDADRVAVHVIGRLRSIEPAPSAIRRIPWRAGIIGLLAAAASVVVFLSTSHRPRSDNTSNEQTVAIVIPELQALDDGELESVLRSMGPSEADATPGNLPHLEDLTDAELEQLLGPKGGE
jgi:hypothetical protein